MTKPIVLVDLDGVCVFFDGPIYEKFGDRLDCTLETQTNYFLTDHCDKQTAKEMRAFVETPGYFRDLPAMPGAIGGMWALAEEADVWLCTKPLEANPTCRDDKAYWVRKHLGVEFEKKMFIAPEKHFVHGAILLDDKPKQHSIPLATWRPVIYQQPYNAGADYAGLPRYHWGLPVDALLQHIPST